MKRTSIIVSGLLGLALSAVPAMADSHRENRGDDQRAARTEVRDTRDARASRDIRRDNDRDDHDDRARYDHDRIDRDHDRVIVQRPVVVEQPVVVAAPCLPDVDYDVQLRDVARNVVDTATCQNLGGIASVQFVRRDGHEFYRFIISGRGVSYDVRVQPNGKLLGIDRC